MAGNDYEEKRDFVRMRVNTQVTYTIIGGDDTAHHGKSIDLSATGLYMSTDYKLNISDEIDFVMNPNGDRLPPFVAQGKVIRCENDPDHENQFLVSLELLKTG